MANITHQLFSIDILVKYLVRQSGFKDFFELVAHVRVFDSAVWSNFQLNVLNPMCLTRIQDTNMATTVTGGPGPSEGTLLQRM